ncbi:nuclear export factor GLE1 [Streptomyces populi]|uniref:Nuclear export factor GLE1 n=1 Tax=Streptomyces populi TaxID=2058924 RepID=A0A2I0ST98_9ACTN|nr:DUF1775 domain-containing protein [Streptomyces populi]PKT73142.1 nuclear export factor GLE1 [Streptomyces populi]
MKLLPPARTAVALITAGLLLATAAPARAHVHVHAEQAVAPGATDVRMTFHVPNEKDSARTVGVRIEAPQGVRGVRAERVKGWTAEPAAAGDAGRTVGWSGGAIGGEDGVDFVVHVDRVPTGVSELAFVARQEYDDGEVVTWDQETVAGQAEPEHPAPVLSLAGAPAADAAAHAPAGPDAAWTAAVVCGALLLLAAAGVPVARAAARRRAVVPR